MISLNHNGESGLKFLVVENDPYDSLLLRAELKKSFNIKWFDVASNGNEGAELAAHKNYDILIVNYELPREDGLTFWFRLGQEGIKIPTVLVIKDSDDEQLLTELKSDHFDFIVNDALFPTNVSPVVDKLLKAHDRRLPGTAMGRTQTNEEWLDALSQTSLAVSHEINNPLTTIIGSTQLLLTGDYALDSRVRTKITIIEESAQRIREIMVSLGTIEKPVSVEIPGGRMMDMKNSGRKLPFSLGESRTLRIGKPV